MKNLGLVGTMLALGLAGASCNSIEQKQAEQTYEPDCKRVELEISTTNEESLAMFSQGPQALFCEYPSGSHQLIMVFPDNSGTALYMTPAADK